MGIVQGTMDTVLNEEGIKQAEITAEELKEIQFAAAFSSDLKRCTKVRAGVLSRPFLFTQTLDARRQRSLRSRILISRSRPTLAFAKGLVNYFL